MLIAIGLTGAAGVWAFVVLLRQLYYICQPSEVLIFAGLRRTTGTGERVGYRTGEEVLNDAAGEFVVVPTSPLQAKRQSSSLLTPIGRKGCSPPAESRDITGPILTRPMCTFERSF